MSNVEVVTKVVEEAYRLPSPKKCPEEIYQWMLDCWNREPGQRPNFKELYNRIERKWENSFQTQPSVVIMPNIIALDEPPVYVA